MSIRKVQFDKISLADKKYYQENGCCVISGLYSPDEISEAQGAVWQEFNQHYGHASREMGSLEPNFSQSEAEWNLYRKPALLEVNNFLTDWNNLFWDNNTGMLIISWPQENDWTLLHLDFFDHGLRIPPVHQDEQVTYILIYLSDANSQSCGRTKIALGSHKIIREHLLCNPDDPRNEKLAYDTNFLGFQNIVPVNVSVGDVLIFDYLLVHSGGGQQKPIPRIVLRTGFHNGKGELADERASIPTHIYSKLTPTERQLGRNSNALTAKL